MSKLTMEIESYLKGTVNLPLFESLDDAGMGKFFDKCAIELTLRHSPKKNYGISKDDFRDLIIEVFQKIYYTGIRFDGSRNLYCYRTCFNQYRLISARTKKEAKELSCSFGFGVNSLGSLKSLRKVDELRLNNNEGIALLDNGEEIVIEDVWLQTVNLFDGCVEISEGGER